MGTSVTGPPRSLLRADFGAGAPLTAGDLQAEQDYKFQRIRRHLRHLHGGGIICGLRVAPAGDSARPWAIVICPGYAVTCCGDEVMVPTRVVVDLRDFLWSRPLVVGAPPPAVVRMQYVVEPVRPVPLEPGRCSCDEDDYRPSRLRDGFAVSISWEIISGRQVIPTDICASGPIECPDCADHEQIALASVRLPQEGDPITDADITSLVDS